MEKYEMTFEELEAQHVELLPDRIEMGRRRNRARVVCATQQQAAAVGIQLAGNICVVQQFNG